VAPDQRPLDIQVGAVFECVNGNTAKVLSKCVAFDGFSCQTISGTASWYPYSDFLVDLNGGVADPSEGGRSLARRID
jgi:tRNA-binding EMAP/Myf-like protein